jgi:hypothetical protein
MRQVPFRILLGLAAVLWPGWAVGAPSLESQGKFCAQATARFERAEGIPVHLLTAISLAETGRWDEDRRASFAWPWTVTAGGEGRYFNTKAEAVAEVKRLQAKGVKNIDVGCMQVNMFHHGDAFESVEAAFDPATNVAYASRFLKVLHDSTRSWTQAAAHYHSTNAERNQGYKEKVLRLWDRAREQARRLGDPDGWMTAEAADRLATGSTAVPAAAKPYMTARAPMRTPVVSGLAGRSVVDAQRTAELNARRHQIAADSRPVDPAARRTTDLAAAQAARGDPQAVAELAVRRRAALQRQWKEMVSGGRSNADSFAARRQAQLAAWRDSRPVAPVAPTAPVRPVRSGSS